MFFKGSIFFLEILVEGHPRFFKVFPLGCHANQISLWNGNILATFKGDRLSIIPVKFGEILQGGLGGELVRRNC